MERTEREAILRQGVVLPETPRDRRELAGLEQDLQSLPQRGTPTRLRLRNFRPAASAYLAAARGPLAYMVRLHVIEAQTADHEERLAEAWQTLAAECDGDTEAFARGWQAIAREWQFSELNELVERHNRWYPVESRLPMDPRTGDYALVNGRDYRLAPLDADWILERFPAALDAVVTTP
jgi:hypothetical protein